MQLSCNLHLLFYICVVHSPVVVIIKSFSFLDSVVFFVFLSDFLFFIVIFYSLQLLLLLLSCKCWLAQSVSSPLLLVFPAAPSPLLQLLLGCLRLLLPALFFCFGSGFGFFHLFQLRCILCCLFCFLCTHTHICNICIFICICICICICFIIIIIKTATKEMHRCCGFAAATVCVSVCEKQFKHEIRASFPPTVLLASPAPFIL